MCISVGLVGLLTGCSPQGWGPSSSMPDVAPGQAANAFTIPDLKGSGDISLSSYAGRVVLLDFWATWCPPCKSELPALNQLYQELQPKGFEVVGMTVDRGSRDKIADVVNTFKLAYPVGLAGSDVQAAYGGIRAVPTKFLLDRNGNIAKTYIGVVPEEEIRADIQALLGT